MNVLFITSRFPYPPLKGDKIRAYYPIKLLSKKHTIDLLSLAEEKVEPECIREMKRYCRKIEIVPLSKYIFNAKLALGILTPKPSQVVSYQSSHMKKLIKRYIDTGDYQLAHIVCGRLADYRHEITKIPVGIDWIDALSLSTYRMFKTEKNVLKKVLYYFEWKKMHQFERSRLKEFDFNVITSQVDRDYLNGSDIEVIPNGVDTSVFHPLSTDRDIDLIFTGNMGYFPNIQAVEFFCSKVFPLILKKRPETTFYIAGANPDRNVLKYRDDKNVFVTGFVDDMNIMLNRARIFVAPLKSGAGIQNKILEAMACKMPVVSTSYGNAGIRAKNGDEIIVSDSPDDMQGIIIELLADTTKQCRIGKNGFELIRKQFSWEAKVNRLNDIYGNFF